MSAFHLGQPRRAWRAFSQWRTSWLSREGVASLATYVPFVLFGALWVLADRISIPVIASGGLASIDDVKALLQPRARELAGARL